jgi:hypothetical protein
MELQDFLDHVDLGALIEAGSEQHRFMHDAAQEALRTVAEINTGYRTPDEVRALLTRLTASPWTSQSPSSHRSTASSART